MTDRPILFSTPMVLALLEGRKVQTRRLAWKFVGQSTPSPWQKVKPGDRLWVRETFAKLWPNEDPPERDQDHEIQFRADTNGKCLPGNWPDECRNDPDCPRWKPAIHMPRWASRLTLVVTAVKIERLQDISRGDAMDEGCPFPNMAAGPNPKDWFCDLWSEIHGPAAWQANPEVVVLTFRVYLANIIDFEEKINFGAPTAIQKRRWSDEIWQAGRDQLFFQSGSGKP